MKDTTIVKKEQYEAIGLFGFDYKLIEEEEGGRFREGLKRHPYLNHLIQLWPGDWVNRMEKMNETYGINNCLDLYGGKKRVVGPFISQEFWECTGLHSISSYLWEESKQALERNTKIFW